MFWGHRMARRLVDEARRWTAPMALPNEDPVKAVPCISQRWIQRYTVPKLITEDGESWLIYEEVAQRLDLISRQLKIKTPHHHEDIVTS